MIFMYISRWVYTVYYTVYNIHHNNTHMGIYKYNIIKIIIIIGIV